MGLQRVGHDLVTEQQQQYVNTQHSLTCSWDLRYCLEWWLLGCDIVIAHSPHQALKDYSQIVVLCYHGAIWLLLQLFIIFLIFFPLQFSCSVVSDSLQPHGLYHTSLPCPSPTPGACSNSCPSSQWWHPAISSCVIPFSPCLQSSPASESFQMSQFFASGCQSIGVSASASVLTMNVQDWFPLGLMGLISLQFKGLSRVFSNTIVQKHQFCSQLSL